jgi:hypothetical protein
MPELNKKMSGMYSKLTTFPPFSYELVTRNHSAVSHWNFQSRLQFWANFCTKKDVDKIKANKETTNMSVVICHEHFRTSLFAIQKHLYVSWRN